MTSMLRVWWLASRPKTLTAAIAPVMIGTALAIGDQAFDGIAALWAFWGAIFIQIGTNFANDYFDFIKGADTENRLGPTRATQAGLVQPDTMKKAFVLMFALASLSGLYLVYRGGWPILLIGIFSIISGILYTGGPKPLGYLGLGDLFVLFFFGIVAVSGTYYVQALTLPTYVMVAGLAPGLLATAILSVNNLRDIDTDRLTGKQTLAVRFGKKFVQWEYAFTILLGCLTPLVLVWWVNGHFYALSALGALVLGLPLIQKVWHLEGRQLNPILGETGKLLLLYSVLFSLGWVFS